MTKHQENLTNALLDFFRAQTESEQFPESMASNNKAIAATDKLVALLAPERGDRAHQIASAIAEHCVGKFVLAAGVEPMTKQGLTDKFTSIILNEGGSL